MITRRRLIGTATASAGLLITPNMIITHAYAAPIVWSIFGAIGKFAQNAGAAIAANLVTEWIKTRSSENQKLVNERNARVTEIPEFSSNEFSPVYETRNSSFYAAKSTVSSIDTIALFYDNTSCTSTLDGPCVLALQVAAEVLANKFNYTEDQICATLVPISANRDAAGDFENSYDNPIEIGTEEGSLSINYTNNENNNGKGNGTINITAIKHNGEEIFSEEISFEYNDQGSETEEPDED